MVQCKVCGGNCKERKGEYVCIFCGASYPANEVESKSSVSAKESSGADIFEQNINGILEIRWYDQRYTHSGSGFLISSDGYCITNTHVVTQEDGRSVGTVSVKLKGEEVKATVIALGDDKHGLGSGDDLALIKLSRIPSGVKVLEFEDFSNVRIGEKVFVIGNSLGYGTCITSGIVSDKERMVNGHMLLMTDCAVNGGNSGGPIFNEKGKVIGAIVSGIDRAEGMNFAIPSKTITQFIRRYK